MVWQPWDNRKVDGTNTVCHCVVYIPAVMHGQIIPYEISMKICARYIVCLNIPANKIAEIIEYICHESNGVYNLNPASRALTTP
jgi:hypothetical protein